MTATTSAPPLSIVDAGPELALIPRLEERKPEKRVRPGVLAAARMFLVLTGLMFGFLAYLGPLSALEHNRTQITVAKNFRYDLEQATALIGGPIAMGTPVAILDIPALDLQEVVFEGTTSEQLAKGPGHRRDTAMPGQSGVSVIAGRRFGFGRPFAKLDELRSGDEIVVTTGQGEHRYRIDRVRRPGDPLPPALVDGGGRLTLVTTDPPLTPTQVFYVDATLTSDAKPAPGGRPTAISDTERTASIDPSAVLPLVLWLHVLLGAGILTAWVGQRWGGWQTYLVGAPVFVATLWNVYSALARLLPNTL